MRPDGVRGQLRRRPGQGPQDQDQGLSSVEGEIPTQAKGIGQAVVNVPASKPRHRTGFFVPGM
ncbi:hypothetical protein EMIT0P218_50266 [Pseudomonas sp. IT-P218]